MNIWIENIYRDILELSDLDKQRNSWLGNDPNYVSSYVKIMCRLFDDNDFDNFIDIESDKLGVSYTLVTELKKLRELLNQYEEGDKTDKEIIEDPLWVLIVNQAKIVISVMTEIDIKSY